MPVMAWSQGKSPQNINVEDFILQVHSHILHLITLGTDTRNVTKQENFPFYLVEQQGKGLYVVTGQLFILLNSVY